MKSARTGTVRVIRTEGSGIISQYGVKKDKPVIFPRGYLESTSIFQDVQVKGDQVMESDLPYHRVFLFYGTERPGCNGCTPLYGDGENELVSMLDGIPATLTRTARQRPDKEWKP